MVPACRWACGQSGERSERPESALPQFLVVAEHLDGQQGDGFQPPKQILDPSGILADDMVDDGPCSGFRRRRDSRRETIR